MVASRQVCHAHTSVTSRHASQETQTSVESIPLLWVGGFSEFSIVRFSLHCWACVDYTETGAALVVAGIMTETDALVNFQMAE